MALSLAIIVLALANTFFIFGFSVFQQQRDRYEVGENLRIGVNRLTRELRQSTEIISYNDVGGGNLNFRNRAGDTISYHISKSGDAEAADQLVRSIRGAGNNPVARYVSRLEVEWAETQGETGPQPVTVTLTGCKGKSGEISLSTAVRLKN